MEHTHFDYKGLVMRHMFPMMMIGFMNAVLKKLARELGGKGEKIYAK